MAIASSSCQVEASWWHFIIWKWNLLSKLKTFLWLVMRNKILSWDNLQKRDFQGPNICVLCIGEGKSIDNLFLRCRAAKTLWPNVVAVLGIKISEHFDSFGDCLLFWYSNRKIFFSIPIFIAWKLWGLRNNLIFENIMPNLVLATSKVVTFWRNYLLKILVRKWFLDLCLNHRSQNEFLLWHDQAPKNRSPG